MAGPQSFTPNSVSPSLPKRRFTLADANRALSLVRRVVTDIVRTTARAQALHLELESVAAKKRSSVQTELDSAMTRLEDYVDELTEIGCELKDPHTGLVDFVGRHENRDVYLCWKLGEDVITHWHELDAGFTGRQPVAKLHETN